MGADIPFPGVDGTRLPAVRSPFCRPLRGGSLVWAQSGGYCARSAPMCNGVGMVLVGLADVFLVPLLLARKWRTPPE